MDTRTRSTGSLPVTRSNTRRREVDYAGVAWVDLAQPTSADLAALRERFGLDPLLLEDVLSAVQRPKLDLQLQDDYLFAIFHIPNLDRDSQIVVSEVKVFAGRDYVVLIHDGSLKPIRRMFAAAATDESARAQLLGRGTGYLLYRIIDTLIKQCFPLVYRVDDDLNRIEGNLFQRNRSTIVRDLTLVQRDIITLYHMIRPNREVVRGLRDLQSTTSLRIDPARYFGDTADGFNRLCDMLEEQQAVATSLGGTLNLLNMQQNNQILRIALLILIAVVPLLLVTSFVGLNVLVPFATQPLYFLGAVLALVALIAGGVAYIHSRKWL